MKRTPICLLMMALATAFFALTGCAATSVPSTPKPTDTPAALLVSISDVERNPDAFRDKLVRMQGYGLIVATVPLCPGYVGQDRRTVFVDAEQAHITAEVRWRQSENIRMYDPDNLRVFEGYIRIFSGEIGCPGATKVETFPYFEIVGVE